MSNRDRWRRRFILSPVVTVFYPLVEIGRPTEPNRQCQTQWILRLMLNGWTDFDAPNSKTGLNVFTLDSKRGLRSRHYLIPTLSQ